MTNLAVVLLCPVTIAVKFGVMFIFILSLSCTFGKNCFIIFAFVHSFHSFCHFYNDSSSISLTLVNTQNVSVSKIVDSSSIHCAETKYGLRIQFLALIVMIHEVWLNA